MDASVGCALSLPNRTIMSWAVTNVDSRGWQKQSGRFLTHPVRRAKESPLETRPSQETSQLIIRVSWIIYVLRGDFIKDLNRSSRKRVPLNITPNSLYFSKELEYLTKNLIQHCIYIYKNCLMF